MPKKFKLHMLVGDGHLRIMPKGNMALKDVNQVLGAARSALNVFPVIVVDLLEVREHAEQVPAILEDGLRYLIAERKMALLREHPHLRWKVYQAVPLENRCGCHGNCHNCPCGIEKEQQAAAGQAKPGKSR